MTGTDDTRRARHRQPAADPEATDPALPIPPAGPVGATGAHRAPERPVPPPDDGRAPAATDRSGSDRSGSDRSGIDRVSADRAVTDRSGSPVPARPGRRRRADHAGAAVAAAGHGHGHGHGPPPAADRRIRIAIAALLIPVVLATVAGLLVLFPYTPVAPAEASPRVAGTVTATAESDCSPGEGDRGCAALTVRLADGEMAGASIVTLVSVVRGIAPFTTGDEVVLVVTGDPADPESYQVEDFQRGSPLLVLALLFAAAVIALARWRGVAALVSLALTAVVLIGFVLPAILAGRDPLAVAVVGCSLIMFCALYLTHGFSARTSTAVLGTLGSLVLIGVLGVAFAAAARLTGADEDTASLSNTLGTAVDARGLVLAALMIGALGALDDVTVTQTSAVWELRAADPTLRPAALFGAAMRIGRDHVASAVNTLVLAYSGAALPLLLLFSVADRGLAGTLTAQVIATEVVRTLVGSIGLVASVPLTTALAVAVVTRGSVRGANPRVGPGAHPDVPPPAAAWRRGP